MLCVCAEEDTGILDLTGHFTGWDCCESTVKVNSGSAARRLSPRRFPLQNSCRSCWGSCGAEAPRVWVWPLPSCSCTPAPVLSCTQQPTDTRSSTCATSSRCSKFLVLMLKAVFHWSCSPVPGVRGSSCWLRTQLLSSSSCVIAATPSKVLLLQLLHCKWCKEIQACLFFFYCSFLLQLRPFPIQF